MKPHFILGSVQSEYEPTDIFAVGDHFSWLAMLAAPFWFLWRGMILHALLAGLIFTSTLVALTYGLPAAYALPILLLIAVWLGFEARFFYIEHLRQNDIDLLDVVMAPNSLLAEELFLSRRSPLAAQTERDNAPTDMGHNSAVVDQKTDLIFSQNWGR